MNFKGKSIEWGAPIIAALSILALGLFTSGCTGGGASNDSTPTPNLNIPANMQANVGSSYELQKTSAYINRTSVNAAGGFLHAIMYADYDMDGDIDVISSPGSGANATTPSELWLNNGADVFTQDPTFFNGAAPGLIHARKGLVGDYNGDGKPDAFIIGHGFDQPPFPGEAPLLFLNTQVGIVASFSQQSTPAPAGFQHGGASADIDSDGDIDIFVADQKQCYFLINDGSGNFTYDISRLGDGFTYVNNYTAELIDIDADGFIDILTGGHEQDGAPTTIMWGDSTGYYSSSNSTNLPIVTNNGTMLDIDAEDIDGDGDRDIILNRTGDGKSASLAFYQGFYIQVIENTGARSFSDATNTRIVGGSNTGFGTWFDYIRIQDSNNDGFVDIIVDDANRNLIWLNDGTGVFN